MKEVVEVIFSIFATFVCFFGTAFITVSMLNNIKKPYYN